jgi:hypothetical protein
MVTNDTPKQPGSAAIDECYAKNMTAYEAWRLALSGWTRIPELEPIIASNAETAFMYAYNIIRGRWPEAEEAIATGAGLDDDEDKACWAFRYLKCVKNGYTQKFPKLHERPPSYETWPEAEEVIKADEGYRALYYLYTTRAIFERDFDSLITTAILINAFSGDQ